MPLFKKRPALIEASQWFRNGDHPEDKSHPLDGPDGNQGRMSEGKVVRYFQSLNIPGDRICSACGNPMNLHGELFSGQEAELICPGDYVITDPKGRYYKLSARKFEAMYEPHSGG